jgi:hypothetical protein
MIAKMRTSYGPFKVNDSIRRQGHRPEAHEKKFAGALRRNDEPPRRAETAKS